MYVPYIINRGEYYRLFTSMFMHFGFDHLANNMVMLLVIGWNLEGEIGKIKFLIIYFFKWAEWEYLISTLGYANG